MRPAAILEGQVAAASISHLETGLEALRALDLVESTTSAVVLSTLIDRARPTAAAKAVRFRSFDGTYTENMTLEQARRPDVIVALRMLGAPVTHDHGGPVRIYAGSLYGYKSTKWLSAIELTETVVPGYWEDTGDYDVDGWVGKSNGRDDDPVG